MQRLTKEIAKQTAINYAKGIVCDLIQRDLADRKKEYFDGDEVRYTIEFEGFSVSTKKPCEYTEDHGSVGVDDWDGVQAWYQYLDVQIANNNSIVMSIAKELYKVIKEGYQTR